MLSDCRTAGPEFDKACKVYSLLDLRRVLSAMARYRRLSCVKKYHCSAVSFCVGILPKRMIFGAHHRDLLVAISVREQSRCIWFAQSFGRSQCRTRDLSWPDKACKLSIVSQLAKHSLEHWRDLFWRSCLRCARGGTGDQPSLPIPSHKCFRSGMFHIQSENGTAV